MINFNIQKMELSRENYGIKAGKSPLRAISSEPH